MSKYSTRLIDVLATLLFLELELPVFYKFTFDGYESVTLRMIDLGLEVKIFIF
jgi:hypothetical protein